MLLEQKAQAVSQAVPSVNLGTILQIITSIFQALSGLSGTCPGMPPTQAKLNLEGVGSRSFVRRHVRQELEDPKEFREVGNQLVQSILDVGRKSTDEEFKVMYKEVDA